jgi:hypothetical protein
LAKKLLESLQSTEREQTARALLSLESSKGDLEGFVKYFEGREDAVKAAELAIKLSSIEQASIH